MVYLSPKEKLLNHLVSEEILQTASKEKVDLDLAASNFHKLDTPPTLQYAWQLSLLGEINFESLLPKIDSFLSENPNEAFTLLQLVAITGQDENFETIIRLVEEKGLSVKDLLTQKTMDGQTLAHIVARSGDPLTIRTFINLAKKNGISIEELITQNNIRGETILHMAGLSGNPRAIKIVIDIALNFLTPENILKEILTKKTSLGETVLHFTAKSGNYLALDVIMAITEKYGMSSLSLFEEPNLNGITPAMFAAQAGDLSTIQIIMEWAKKNNLSAKDVLTLETNKNNLSAIDLLTLETKKNHHRLVNYLLQSKDERAFVYLFKKVIAELETSTEISDLDPDSPKAQLIKAGTQLETATQINKLINPLFRDKLLNLAVKSGNLLAVEAIIEIAKNYGLPTVSSPNATIILDAISSGNLLVFNAILNLLEEKKWLEGILGSSYNFTMLDVAIKLKNPAMFLTIIELLEKYNISFGEIFEKVDYFKDIVSSGSVEVLTASMEILEKKGVLTKDLLSRKYSGDLTIFHRFAGGANLSSFEGLIDIAKKNGMPINDLFKQYAGGKEGLFYLAAQSKSPLALQGVIEVAQKNGVTTKDINELLKFTLSIQGRLYHSAALQGNEVLLKNLIRMAEKNGIRAEDIKVLLTQRVHVISGSEQTIMHLAARSGNILAFQTLVELAKKYNIPIKELLKQKTLKSNGREEKIEDSTVAHIFSKSGHAASIEAIAELAEKNDLSVTELLKQTDDQGMNMAMHAAASGKVEAIEAIAKLIKMHHLSLRDLLNQTSSKKANSMSMADFAARSGNPLAIEAMGRLAEEAGIPLRDFLNDTMLQYAFYADPYETQALEAMMALYAKAGIEPYQYAPPFLNDHVGAAAKYTWDPKNNAKWDKALVSYYAENLRGNTSLTTIPWSDKIKTHSDYQYLLEKIKGYLERNKLIEEGKPALQGVVSLASAVVGLSSGEPETQKRSTVYKLNKDAWNHIVTFLLPVNTSTMSNLPNTESFNSKMFAFYQHRLDYIVKYLTDMIKNNFIIRGGSFFYPNEDTRVLMTALERSRQVRVLPPQIRDMHYKMMVASFNKKFKGLDISSPYQLLTGIKNQLTAKLGFKESLEVLGKVIPDPLFKGEITKEMKGLTLTEHTSWAQARDILTSAAGKQPIPSGLKDVFQYLVYRAVLNVTPEKSEEDTPLLKK